MYEVQFKIDGAVEDKIRCDTKEKALAMAKEWAQETREDPALAKSCEVRVVKIIKSITF